MTLSERIVDFALELHQKHIPSDVLSLARLHTIDALGVGIAASGGSVQQQMAHSLLKEQPYGNCSLLGHRTRTHSANATLLNGSFIHSLEYDDTHMASIVHGSSVLVPAALAAVEQHQLSLGELTRLITIGWEVLVRIGLAAPGAFQRRGFQVTSVGGALVAALLAGLAAGASRSELIAAQGIAGSQASGIFEFLSDGSSVKGMHPGWAAHSGSLAATLAIAGMTGPSTVYEGRFGLYNTYTDDAGAAMALGKALDSLGEKWMLREAAFKLFPCCHYIHPFLEVVQNLHAQNVVWQSIQSIECKVPQGAAAIICEPWARKQTPNMVGEAKHSLPYCLALAFLDIPITAQHFLSDRVDAKAVEFAQKINWSPMHDADFPNKFQAEIYVHLADGQTLTSRIDQVKGSADRPASSDEIETKFKTNTSARYKASTQNSIMDWMLHGAADLPITQLSALLAED